MNLAEHEGVESTIVLERHPASSCPHSWRYYVDMQCGRVGSKRCEACGEERALERGRAPRLTT